MLREFQAVIEPLNKELGAMLSTEDDYTIIPVNVTLKSGRKITVENGLITDCDHADAELGDVEIASLHYNPLTGNVEKLYDTELVPVCGCGKQQDIEGEWYE